MPNNADLSRVSIGIKTFLRDSHLREAIAGIRLLLPETQMVIADDGRLTAEKQDLYSDLQQAGHIVGQFAFDSGFGLKSNWIAHNFMRDYLLVASDDFDFHSLDVRSGIQRMIQTLDQSDMDIASGRVNGYPYEFFLEDLGDKIIEHPVAIPSYGSYASLLFLKCDLTVNYSLMRRQVFENIRWDDDVKIGGGEHGAFFLDAMRASIHTAYVPGANINTQRKPDPPEYKPYRARALSPERPCFKKRGVKTYILGNGVVDYQEDK